MSRKKLPPNAQPVDPKAHSVFQQEAIVWCPDGSLCDVFWHYDEQTETGCYYQTEIQISVLPFLMRPVVLHPECTLRSVFITALHFEKELNPIIGNWMLEFLNEAFSPLPENYVPSTTERLDLLELYYAATSQNDTYYGLNYPSFHALGQSFVDYDGQPLAPGTTRPEQYSISFTPVNQLMSLPLQVRPTMFFEIDHPLVLTQQLELPTPAISILQLLYGIFWELSFYGPPSKRDQAGQELLEQSADV